jgi:hypothetical protein
LGQLQDKEQKRSYKGTPEAIKEELLQGAGRALRIMLRALRMIVDDTTFVSPSRSVVALSPYSVFSILQKGN